MRTILIIALASLTTFATAGAAREARTARDMARVECAGQATAMMYAFQTAMRRNYIRDCMIEKGFQSR